MTSLLFDVTPETQDAILEQLWSAGTTGIIERETTLEAFFDDPVLVTAQLAHLHPRVREHEPIDWEQYTRDSFPPVEVGTRFFLAPPWSRDTTPAGRIRLVINPGLACGTGYHPCTQLCLIALERHLRPGSRVLDVGSGSGILSVAATHLGAFPIACDNDPEAILHCATPIRFVGSVDAIMPQSFDALIANISEPVNRELWPRYVSTVRPGGIIILSGFEHFDPPAVPLERLEQDGWLCLVFSWR
jgi:ribosomal protein L11 methyltransferase